MKLAKGLAHFWDLIEQIEACSPALEQVATSDDKYRKSALSLVRRLRSNALSLTEIFDDGPAFFSHGPWRRIERRDVLPLAERVREDSGWISQGIMNISAYGQLSERERNELALELRGAVASYQKALDSIVPERAYGAEDVE